MKDKRKEGDKCELCGKGVLKLFPTAESPIFGDCFHRLFCNYCQYPFAWTRKELEDIAKKVISETPRQTGEVINKESLKLVYDTITQEALDYNTKAIQEKDLEKRERLLGVAIGLLSALCVFKLNALCEQVNNSSIDFEKLLKKYAYHINYFEGMDYIYHIDCAPNTANESVQFSQQEVEYLKAMTKTWQDSTKDIAWKLSYKDLLKKYIGHIYDNEGITYIGTHDSEVPFTELEYSVMEKLNKEVKNEKGEEE